MEQAWKFSTLQFGSAFARYMKRKSTEQARLFLDCPKPWFLLSVLF